MSGAGESVEPIREFSDATIAPTGEWWAEFSVGLSLREEGLDLGDRRLDAICITSRDQSAPEKLPLDNTRQKWDEGWLDGEDVAILEHGTGDYAWAKYGELDIRRRMFERDWPKANIKKYILLMEPSSKSGNEDTAWMFENELADYEHIVKVNGDYYAYGDFVANSE